MEKYYTDCDIVLELLPLYIEQKTGSDSNDFIRNHLPQCKDCQEAYELMKLDLKEPTNSRNKSSKCSSSNKRRIFILTISLLGYLFLVVGIVIYTYSRLAVAL